MDRKFVINQMIEFTPHANRLQLVDKSAEVQLPVPASLLLLTLLNANSDVITREYIFDKVWEQYGITASNSNLNHYMGVLRKSLLNLGLNEELIITIPKLGFRVNQHVDIQDNEARKNRISLTIKRRFPISTIISLVFITLGFIVTSLVKIERNIPYEIFSTYKNCSILFDNQVLLGDVENALFIVKSKIEELGINCSKGKDLVIYDDEFYTENIISPSKDNIFIAHCFDTIKPFNNCDNYSFTVRYTK